MRPPRARPPAAAPPAPQEARARAMALAAAARAYAPYSGFRVGAVLEDSEGRLHPGCNIESSSLGLSLCAERTALGLALAAGAVGFTRIWIYTPTAKATTPCGACRDLLSRFAPRLTVRLLCDGGRARTLALDRLLPNRDSDAGRSRPPRRSGGDR